MCIHMYGCIGYGIHEAVVYHIWNNVGQHSINNVAIQTQIDQEPVPQLRLDWITDTETSQIYNLDVHYEV